MNQELELLDEIRTEYFTDTDEVRQDNRITADEVGNLKDRLFKVVLNGQNSIITEVTESYITELENALKQA